jgi:hypothetical protein
MYKVDSLLKIPSGCYHDDEAAEAAKSYGDALAIAGGFVVSERGCRCLNPLDGKWMARADVLVVDSEGTMHQLHSMLFDGRFASPAQMVASYLAIEPGSGQPVKIVYVNDGRP